MTHRCYLLLGSNIEPERNLPAAVARLRAHGLVAVSGAWQTRPVGARDGPAFLNAAALLATDLTPEAVKLDVCAAIERELGRTRDPHDRNAPRTIDLDICLWDDLVGRILDAPVPDPDIRIRPHVLWPLAELAPGLELPGDGRRLADIQGEVAATVNAAEVPVARSDVRFLP